MPFALDANRSNFIATGAVLPKPAYADHVDPALGYAPKLKDGNGDVVQAVDEDGRLIWTFDVQDADEDKPQNITVTFAGQMPVIKRYQPVKLHGAVLKMYARQEGKRANLAVSITAERVEDVKTGQSTPSVAPSQAKAAA
jgi:hypothetical protein